jgi:hypothetical protein
MEMIKQFDDWILTMFGFALVLVMMIARAIGYASQRTRDCKSMGLSFHCFSGSRIRMRNRMCCSESVIENQYLTSLMPERTSMRSNSGALRKNSATSSSVQKPMTRSTPARS